MKLSRLGEFGLIERIRRKVAVGRGVRLGIGDDAAWVDHPQGSSLVTADLLIEGIHFDLRWTSLADLGYKSVAVNLSDIAAMGGTPAYVMLSLGIPVNFDSSKIDALYRGINSQAKKYGISIVGGDTNTADSLIISVCLIGHPPKKPIYRSGAHAGDDIYVTGTLGDAALGLSLLRLKRQPQSRAVAQLLKRHHRPTPRLAAGALLAKRNLASAMIDISDGLIQDLGHICQASGIGANIRQDTLPLSSAYRALAGKTGMQHALSGGEDYELLFCAAPRQRKRIATLSKQAGVPITRIGVCVPPADGIKVFDTADAEIVVKAQGHDHFKKK
ncbi:MAG TPA: thiamine-phosphate kinase [Candidatus Binatia bacterium]|nr:thiamine-phosphate kinase [Candidatus Binatia bacterium]